MQDSDIVSPVRKFFRNTWVRVILVLDAVVVLALIGVAIFNSTKVATVDIMLVPSVARAKIGLSEYAGGTYKIHPGDYEVEVAAEGFQSKTVAITARAGEISKVYVYLVPEEGNLNYYAQHFDDWQNMRLIEDAGAQRVYNILAIREKLPMERIEQEEIGEEDLNVSAYIFIKESSESCEKYYCLRVATAFDKNEEIVRQMLAQKGFDLDNYGIEWVVYTGSEALTEMQSEVSGA